MTRKFTPNVGIEGMSRIGFFPNETKEFEVYVNTDDDGKIPHFHVGDANDWDRFDCSIRYDSPEYYPHEGSRSKLNTKQIKALIAFLNEQSRYYKGYSIWQLAIYSWNSNNSGIQLLDDLEMPDYRKLK